MPKTEGIIHDVSDTAYWIAYYRGQESERTDALFHDPLARELAGEHGRKIAAHMPAMTAWTVVMRTRIIDDFIQQAVAEGVDMVVNLGAGLDTRPYRLDLPEILTWIEIDKAHLLDYKIKKLADYSPRCKLLHHPLDLANLQARRSCFQGWNQRAKKILILTEGLMPYLSFEEASLLAQDLRAMTQVKQWIVEYHSPETLKFRNRGGMKKNMQNAPFKFIPTDWFGFFKAQGWQATEMRYYAEVCEDYQRPAPYPWYLKTFFHMMRPFTPLETQKKLRRYAGYGLVIPITEMKE